MADICSTVYSIFFIYCLHWRLLNSLAKVLDSIFSTHKIYIILPIHFFISIFAVRVMHIVAKQWRTLKYERFLSRYLIFKKAQQPTNYKEVILFYKTYGKYYKKVSHVYESVAPQCLNYLRNFGSSNTNVLKCTFYGAGLAGRAAGRLFLSAFNTRRKP